MRLVLIVAALAAPPAVVDRTLSCPVIQEGQAHLVDAQGSVTTPRNSAYLKFWPTPLAWDEPAVQPGLEVDTHPGKILWDGRGWCDSSSRRIALTPHGLKLDTVVTTHFLGSADARCLRATPRIRFRARIVVSHGEPARAQLAVVTDRESQPILYVEWTPSRVAYWLRPGCST